jgi:hypothetical protein
MLYQTELHDRYRLTAHLQPWQDSNLRPSPLVAVAGIEPAMARLWAW